MDLKLEGWKNERPDNNKEVLKRAYISFNPDGFNDGFPTFVKDALSNARAKLFPKQPEFTGAPIHHLEKNKITPVPRNSNLTYQVSNKDMLEALDKVDPQASLWWKKNVPKKRVLVFTNEQVEGIPE